MPSNLYVRENLPATRKGVCDPSSVVDVRLAKLADMMEGWYPHGADLRAYDFLATLAWLERIRPEILTGLDTDNMVEAARRRLELEGQEFRERAIRVPKPEGWIEQAKELQASYEELIDPVERAELARRLIEDLDDAELVDLTVTRAGCADQALREALEGCRSWYRKNADVFLAAGTYAQTVGLALKPDLVAVDPALGRTAEKFVQVLDALEDLEAECEWTDLPGFNGEELGSILERYTAGREIASREPGRDPRVIGALPVDPPVAAPMPQPEVFALAAAGNDTAREYAEWQSPDGRSRAVSEIFGTPASSNEPVVVYFYDDHDRPAHTLIGLPVASHRAKSKIEAVEQEAGAMFFWLDRPREGETLRVGSETWDPRNGRANEQRANTGHENHE